MSVGTYVHGFRSAALRTGMTGERCFTHDPPPCDVPRRGVRLYRPGVPANPLRRTPLPDRGGRSAHRARAVGFPRAARPPRRHAVRSRHDDAGRFRTLRRHPGPHRPGGADRDHQPVIQFFAQGASGTDRSVTRWAMARRVERFARPFGDGVMSKHAVQRRMTSTALKERKGGDRIVALTAYTTPMAALLDPHADLILVGDSVGMVLHGLPDTIGVTLDMMALHGRAVMRGASRALVAVDLPFGSYEASPVRAYDSAARLLKETGCQAVKVEACEGIADTISFLVGRGVPAIGHVGLRPQAMNVEGGF